MTDALLSAAALTPDSVVLDLAAGSGDPALTIAERVIRGRVIALDSSRAGCCLLAHTLGGSAWDERSASFRRMHMRSPLRRIAWIGSRVAAESCSSTTQGGSCQRCCACLNPEDALPF
jgi:hypothetical protein